MTVGNQTKSTVDLIGNIVIGAVMLAIFVGGFLAAQRWPVAAGLFPLFITIGGGVLSAAFLTVTVVPLIRSRGDRQLDPVTAPDPEPDVRTGDVQTEPGDSDDEMLSGAEEEDFGLDYVFESATAVQWLRTLGWLAAYFVGLWVLGVILTTAIISVLYLKFEARAGLVAAAVYGLVLAAILWGSQQYLQLNLPGGLFGAG